MSLSHLVDVRFVTVMSFDNRSAYLALSVVRKLTDSGKPRRFVKEDAPVIVSICGVLFIDIVSNESKIVLVQILDKDCRIRFLGEY